MYVVGSQALVPLRRVKARSTARGLAPLHDPSIDARDRVGLGLSFLLERLLAPERFRGRVEEVLPALETALQQVVVSAQYAKARGTQRIEVEKKLRLLVIGPLRNTILTTIGGIAYLDAYRKELLHRTFGKTELKARLASSGLAEVPPSAQGVPSLTPGRRYWHTPAIETRYPFAEDDQFMRGTVEGLLHPALNRALYFLDQSEGGRDLLRRARDYHQENRDLRTWLMEHTRYEGSGSLPIARFEDSIAGLPSENMATVLHVINAWIHAVFVELPLRLDSDERKLLRRTLRTSDQFERTLISNWQTLALALASVSHDKSNEVLDDPPRRAAPIKCGMLRAELVRTPQGGARIVASWNVPGVNGALKNPNKCTGVPIFLTTTGWTSAVSEASNLLIKHRLAVAPSTQLGSYVSLVGIAWMLGVLHTRSALRSRLVRVAPWLQFPAGQVFLSSLETSLASNGLELQLSPNPPLDRFEAPGAEA